MSTKQGSIYPMVKCVECGAVIDYGDEIEVGQILDCPRCWITFEVVSVDPAEFVVLNA